MVGYNPFPDEKGTESYAIVDAIENSVLSAQCYNPFPDEKGTERIHQEDNV